ncbi:MAG: NUDIX domain-containing protein [Chloroflexota bacterium]
MPTLAEAAHGYCFRCGTPLVLRHQEDRDRPTCPACGFIVYLDPKVAVAVVVGDGERVLLGRRAIDPSSGLWSFPAGYVNRGEILEEAAIREVFEELGIVIRLTGLVGVYSAAGDAVILVVYSGEIVSGEPHADGHEVTEVRTFRLDALPPDLAFPHDRQVLLDWKRVRQTGRLIGA